MKRTGIRSGQPLRRSREIARGSARARAGAFGIDREVAASPLVNRKNHYSRGIVRWVIAAGLARATDRWDDAPYLARVLFQAMIGTDTGTTGYGISTRLGDNSYPLLVVDIARKVVVEYPETEYEEHGFAKLGSYRGSAFATYSGKWKKRTTEAL
jgi:hypothetical protein